MGEQLGESGIPELEKSVRLSVDRLLMKRLEEGKPSLGRGEFEKVSRAGGDTCKNAIMGWGDWGWGGGAVRWGRVRGRGWDA